MPDPRLLGSVIGDDQPIDLAVALRSHTRQAHERLERSLDLLRRAERRQAFLPVLERFFGFHRVWETAIARKPALENFHRPRRRVAALRRDLEALGRSPREIESLPLCHEAAGLAAHDAEALGSLYVLEGSTLGGQVVGRALTGADWLPAGGLGYFDPYGARTGEMWRDFKAWLQDHPAAADRASVLQGAVRTFELLHGWVAA